MDFYVDYYIDLYMYFYMDSYIEFYMDLYLISIWIAIWKSMEINGNQSKSMEIDENQWKSMKSMKINDSVASDFLCVQRSQWPSLSDASIAKRKNPLRILWESLKNPNF